MKNEEIVNEDTWADEIERDAVEKGYSDSDATRWKVAEAVARKLEEGLSQRELARQLTDVGRKKYTQQWVNLQKQVWIRFGSDTTRLCHFGAYRTMIDLLPNGDFDAILEEARRTGQSPATITKRIVAEARQAKRDAKEAAENKKTEARQNRIKASKEKTRARLEAVEEPIIEEEKSDEEIISEFDIELSGIRKRSLDLINIAAEELTDASVDVRLNLNQQIDELINILNNVKQVISGIMWNEEIDD